ncbi:carbohydrate ABC transporter substrate-binding protein (CUT1 family) [Herbihabitans rhizosphaerae]|uniref:Carbohydrate ABC transporter substrate-binding protein (CUT1 family) n=1 Tax=Herbihabitans rhizosphaerae TaxID=1872711 RepID=A0A4Q7L872_9PSEU|nr:carbohydrate ABC transporter substrate-binding protein (CUT1 family) [Herbihabitans rhizosphaerae]
MIATAIMSALALALTACGGSSDSGSGEGGTTELELLVPSYGDKTKPYWEQLIKDFEAKNTNIKVKLEVQSWDDIYKVLDTKVQGKKQPDILELDSAGPAYGKEDLLYKADEIVSPATMSDIVSSFVDSAKIDGTAYGVPTVASTRALFYNKDLFAKAGIQSPPKTWDELLDAAKKIKALGGDVAGGYGMPLGSEEAQGETSIWAYGAGASWSDGSKITVNTPQATEALTFMKRMVSEKATQANPGATNRTPLINVFIQGKIGMITGLPPVVGQIKEKNPALQYGIAPSPTKDGKPVTLGVADYFVAFKKDQDKKDAIRKFLDFFYQKDNYVKFNDNEGFIPATKSGGAAVAAKPELKTFLDAVPAAKFYPASLAAWGSTSGAFKSLVGQIETKSAGDVLKEIQQKADSGG